MATEITIEKVVGTSGSYPALYSAVQTYLESEYDAGRLNGADYAQVAIALMQNALNQAIQFELTKGQVAAQTDLTLSQIETQNQQTLNMATEGNNLILQGQLLVAQIAQTEAETETIIERGGFR